MKLKINNFLKIKDFEYEFKPGLVTVVGSNSSGKSSMLYALYTIFLNPRGSQSDIKHGNSSFELSLGLGKNLITLHRTKTTAKYTINGKTYQKIGNKTLFDLMPSIPFYKVNNKSLLQVQTEEDSLFPYTETPSSLFEIFENIIGMFSSKAVLTDIEIDIRNTSTNISTYKGMTEQIEAKLKLYKPIIDMKSKYIAQIEKLEKYVIAYNEKNKDSERLKELCKKNTTIKRISKIEVEKLELFGDILKDIKRFNDLKSYKEIKPIEFKLSEPPLEEDRYKFLISSLRTSIMTIKNLTYEKKEIEDKLKEYKACPLCGNSLISEGIK